MLKTSKILKKASTAEYKVVAMLDEVLPSYRYFTANVVTEAIKRVAGRASLAPELVPYVAKEYMKRPCIQQVIYYTDLSENYSKADFFEIVIHDPSYREMYDMLPKDFQTL